MDNEYQNLISGIIKKFIIILGKEVAISRAAKTGVLEVSEDGTVTKITGNPQEALNKLISSYSDLSGQAAVNIIQGYLKNARLTQTERR